MKDKQEIIESVITSTLRRGETFIDIGAFIGVNTLTASDIVGPNGQVFAFEPALDNYKTLEKNTANIDNIVAINAVASNRKSEVDLYLSKYNPEDNRLYDFDDAYNAEVAETIRLDDYNFQFDIALIKVSACGAEDFAIDGAQNLLHKHKPKILVEFDENLIELTGGDPATVLTYYEALGYNFKFLYNEDKSGLLWLVPSINK